MKWLAASDIHGSAYYCELLLERFFKEKADRLVLLGDILYHGARNDLPKGYEPKKVISMLGEVSDSILCVRGNCDAEVDQMVLSFPVTADYAALDLGKRLVFLTHGHIYNEDNPLPMKRGDIMLSGHTHVPKCTENNGRIFLNPGSVSLPKENSENGYITVEDGEFVWKNLKGEAWRGYVPK